MQGAGPEALHTAARQSIKGLDVLALSVDRREDKLKQIESGELFDEDSAELTRWL